MIRQKGELLDFDAAVERIRSGRPLALAGDRSVLADLPEGNWVAGTSPYFMTREQGECRRDRIFVQELAGEIAGIQSYTRDTLPGFLEDAPENGYTVIILPSGTAIHHDYAEQSPRYPEMYLKPVVGWVAGVHLDDLGREQSQVLDGRECQTFSDRAVAIHLALPQGQTAMVHAVNLFGPDDGPVLRFDDTGFEVDHCLVAGERMRFSEFLKNHDVDCRRPLVADYCGAAINVSIQAVDEDTGKVRLYAPVFPNVEYRLAKPVDDYAERFSSEMPGGTGEILFGCNCILNYQHCGLEGRATEGLAGPITFGEIAYQLLNQTAVVLTLEAD